MNWLVNEANKTAIENYKPAQIKFLNQICFVAFDDYTKVFDFQYEGNRPLLLDIIRKPIGRVLDLRISEDFSQIYVVDQPLIDEAANEIPRMNLYFINSDRINTDRNVSVS